MWNTVQNKYFLTCFCFQKIIVYRSKQSLWSFWSCWGGSCSTASTPHWATEQPPGNSHRPQAISQVITLTYSHTVMQSLSHTVPKSHRITVAYAFISHSHTPIQSHSPTLTKWHRIIVKSECYEVKTNHVLLGLFFIYRRH